MSLVGLAHYAFVVSLGLLASLGRSIPVINALNIIYVNDFVHHKIDSV